MNNKGMTLVELIVAFAIVMIIILGIFNLTVSIRKDLNIKAAIREAEEYANLVNTKVHYALIEDKPFLIAIKDSDTSTWICKYEDGTNCNVSNYIEVNYKNKKSTSDLVKTICADTYPCTIYAYLDNDTIKYKYIFVKNTDKKGISALDTFRALPSNELITFKEDMKMEIKDGMYIFDYPLHIKNGKEDFGFKIAYPFIK